MFFVTPFLIAQENNNIPSKTNIPAPTEENIAINHAEHWRSLSREEKLNICNGIEFGYMSAIFFIYVRMKALEDSQHFDKMKHLQYAHDILNQSAGATKDNEEFSMSDEELMLRIDLYYLDKENIYNSPFMAMLHILTENSIKNLPFK